MVLFFFVDLAAHLIPPSVEIKVFQTLGSKFMSPKNETETEQVHAVSLLLGRLVSHWEENPYDFKVGILSPINDSLSWFAQGGLFHRDGINPNNTYPGDSYFADIGLERKVGISGFIGAGVGVWNLDDRNFDDGSFFT